ncbi:MAG: DUF1080 domain-containing protein [Bacteroidota bacterium]
MTRLFAAGILLLTLVACNNNADPGKTENTDTSAAKTETTMSILTDQEKADGWQVLFDGKTAAGWHTYGGAPVGTAWKINDGVLWLDASTKYDKDPSEKTDMKVVGGGNLLTDEDFENFDLKLEWKIDTAGNSGILFYVAEDTVKYKEPYHTGPEMQVVDNDRHPDGKLVKHMAGDLYDLIACSKKTVKPAGEWNLAEIKSLNGKLDLYLNGENVVSTMMWDDNWKKMVAGSKFKEWKDFGTFKKGKICLQDHDNMVSYRNIRIKRL